MDIVRKSPTSRKKLPTIIGACLGLVGLVSAVVYALDSKHVVSSDNVLLDRVQRGEFSLDIRGIGVLVPKDIYWVATEVNGRVDKIFIKAGAAVKKGDPIISLSNPALVQQLEESQWELEEIKAQLNAQTVSLESQVLDQETLVFNSKLNYERALLTLNAQLTLIDNGTATISKIEHEEVKIEVEQLLQRWQLEQKRYTKSQENLAAQKKAFDARLNRMQRSVDRMQHLVDSLQITASIDSIVQEMPLELGQQIVAGSNIARLANNDVYIAELRVPEKQIYQVALNQEVTLDTRTSLMSGLVQRIDPAVVNGSVQVDIEIRSELPKEVRPELTVEGEIHVAKLDDALYIKRPMFAKANDAGSVYLVNPENNNVTLSQVTYGRASQTHIEIKNGLSVGDNVVISDVSSWKEKQIQAIQ